MSYLCFICLLLVTAYLCFQFCYAATLASIFILAMGNKPKASEWKYKIVTTCFSLLTMYMVACAVVCAVRAAGDIQDQLFIKMIVSLATTYGIYIAASIFALDPWHMLTSFIPYVILSPMYLNILTIYAFCNLDDVSGTTFPIGTYLMVLISLRRYPGAQRTMADRMTLARSRRRIPEWSSWRSWPSPQTSILRISTR